MKTNSVNLVDSVQYSDDSIVSRTLIKTNGGTITLFAFDKGQALSEHAAPFDAFVQVIEGKANVLIDKKMHAVNQGEYILMPANIPHAIEAAEKFKMILIMIKDK